MRPRHSPLSLRRLAAQESGASAVEFALILPILVALLIGTIDLGRMAWTKMEVQAAARAGANYALVNASKGFDPDKTAAAVTNATGLAVTLPQQPYKEFGCPDAVSGVMPVANGTTPCASGDKPGSYVTVQARTAFVPLWLGAVTLSATAKVRIA